ncbi:MAG: biopolymer transporter ExbD [Verrucomicrobia bacterium]|nr:biopolymer transporter ExbD [Verrucomicrobiota bacterium]NDA27012.1 biopolymer transporter ExbD [Verrucomicrobiota bacterium]NDD57466.1 biopolymer transporter ExbD [Verrucomicrobiota bacterium]
MRRSSRSHHGTVLAELNITPLLDLVFVLLIIFMITTPLLEQQLPVDLPKSSQSASSNLPDPKSILPLTIHKDGTVMIGQDSVGMQQLPGVLTRRKNADPELVVSLRADSSVPYETIFRALEAVRSAGARLDLANLPDRPR